MLLPDGQVGRLLWAPAPQREGASVAKVLAGGRHYRVPNQLLVVVPEGMVDR